MHRSFRLGFACFVDRYLDDRSINRPFFHPVFVDLPFFETRKLDDDMAITREPSLRIRGPWMKWANSLSIEYVLAI